MKKLIIALFLGLLFTGCSCSLNDTKPTDAIETFFDKYRMHDDNVILQLKQTIENEITDDNNRKDYQELMEKQYDQFAYVIKDITEDKDTAVATIELTVLNYHEGVLEAEKEYEKNKDQFNDAEGNYDEEKYMSYKIKKMKEVNDTVTHTITLNLTKENGMWKVEQLSNDDITKLHGLY